MMYSVDVTNSVGYLFNIKSGGYEFVVDMKGLSGITPPDTLLAGLGSCIGVYIRKYLEGAKLDAKEFTIKVEADFSKEAPICFRQINIAVVFRGIVLDERRKKSLVEFVKNCPVHNTLKNNPSVEIKIT